MVRSLGAYMSYYAAGRPRGSADAAAGHPRAGDQELSAALLAGIEDSPPA